MSTIEKTPLTFLILSQSSILPSTFPYSPPQLESWLPSEVIPIEEVRGSLEPAPVTGHIVNDTLSNLVLGRTTFGWAHNSLAVFLESKLTNIASGAVSFVRKLKVLVKGNCFEETPEYRGVHRYLEVIPKMRMEYCQSVCDHTASCRGVVWTEGFCALSAVTTQTSVNCSVESPYVNPATGHPSGVVEGTTYSFTYKKLREASTSMKFIDGDLDPGQLGGEIKIGYGGSFASHVEVWVARTDMKTNTSDCTWINNTNATGYLNCSKYRVSKAGVVVIMIGLDSLVTSPLLLLNVPLNSPLSLPDRRPFPPVFNRGKAGGDS